VSNKQTAEQTLLISIYLSTSDFKSSAQPQALFSLYLDRTVLNRSTASMPTPAKQRKIAIVGSRSVGESMLPTWALCVPCVYLPVVCRSSYSQTGKSSLTVQFVDGHFVESYYPTIENTFSKVIKYKGQEYATEIIDTAGQVRDICPFLE
jgi:hypothetical protein